MTSTVALTQFRNFRDGMFTRDIPEEIKLMDTSALLKAIKDEAFIDPFKYLELKSRGVQP